MSKIHKALTKAAHEKVEGKPIAPEEIERHEPGFSGCDRHLITLFKPKSIAAEQIRKLKTSLLERAGGDCNRCILITSAVQGEGKSLTATNLAISLAQEINEHVLIIDADLRRPSLDRYLGLNARYGLSDYLADNDALNLPELLVKTAIPKLSALPAGSVTSSAAELLASEKMRNLVKEVRSRYDDRYIIIDSTPIMSTSEPDILSGQVDKIIFIVKAGKTPREVVKRSLLRIDKEKILGVVLNNVDLQTTGYHYGYYRYYGYYGRENAER